MFPSEIVIFPGLRLSHGHFGQQVSESIVSQLQNGVSTSSLSPFCGLIYIQRLLKVQLVFFSMGILEGVKGQTLQADYNGPK